MAYDFKKEFRELYRPSGKPGVVTVSPMSYVAVRGKGDPNAEGGEYQNALPLLYGVAYTIKMSKKGPREIEGYFDFVVPPLEGFWWQDRADGEIDYARKDDFNFISCIRLPDFVTREDFDWAVSEAAAKKKLDFSAVELLRVDEGLCVQCMHTGPYDDEPATVDAMRAFAAEQGLRPRLLRSPPASRDLPLRPAQVRAGEAQDRDPPSHKVDLAKRVAPRASAIGVYQLAVRYDRASCPASRQARNSFSRFVSRCALCSSCGPEL